MRFRRLAVLLVLCLLAVSALRAQDSPSLPARDQLLQLTSQLQQSPGYQALRERIIALALTLSPKPATPDAATMAEGGAEYILKNAKAASDYSAAAKQYEKALLLAPWLAADYFNCGVAHEKAGETRDAIRNFGLYLLAAPSAEDAQAVKKRIGGLQYASEEVQQAQTAAAAEERTRREYWDRLGFLAGAWNTAYNGQPDYVTADIALTARTIVITRDGRILLRGAIEGDSLSSIKWVQIDSTRSNLPDFATDVIVSRSPLRISFRTHLVEGGIGNARWSNVTAEWTLTR
jgi:tetratricopeptide (TPR) repeat protein